jgi:choline/glycine/proline betaine transport protein
VEEGPAARRGRTSDSDDDQFGHEYDSDEDVVTTPEAVEPAPEFRDPYIDEHGHKVKREGTLASRTGSRRMAGKGDDE